MLTSRRWPLVLLLIFTIAVLAACGDEGETSPDTDAPDEREVTGDLEVVMDDMRFSPDRISGSPGETIEIVLRNPDTMKHDFTIDDLNGEKIQETLDARSVTTFTLTLPDEPGEWVFYCSIPGHQQLGMEGLLVVE